MTAPRITNRALLRDWWPSVRFYDKQWEIIDSVEDNPETIVVAGNKLGKDYAAGFICLSHFLRWPEVRVVTHSVRDDHLSILWGEIMRFVRTCRIPLDSKDGGPLIIRHQEMKKMRGGQICPISYMKGIVSEKGEGMAGHHAEHTLFCGDEASGIEDVAIEAAQGWAKRILLFGNPNACSNYWRRAVEGGDVART